MLTTLLSLTGLLVSIIIQHPNVAEADDMGHFQVHNEQEGDLKIHATKEIAQIETHANSVQVVLEPGKVNAPKISENKGTIKKLVHVVNPVYMGGLRRSKISGRSDKELVNFERIKRAVKEGEKTFENSIMLEKWKNENRHLFESKFDRRHSIRRRSISEARKYKKETLKAKKTQIEKATRVHGRTGGLHVVTGKHGTKLISKGGALNVFIKNEGEEEEKKEMDEDSERRSFDHNTQYHVIGGNMNGLSLKRDADYENTEKRKPKCVIPPCTS